MAATGAIITTAAKNTVIYTIIAFIGGLLLGLALALMKLSPVAPYRWAATAYIELFRGLPALLVIFGFAFAVPIAFQWRPPGGIAGAGLIALILVPAPTWPRPSAPASRRCLRARARRPGRWA